MRGSNGVAPGRVDRVPADLEMAALDDLGPLCRQVIVNGPLSFLAYSVVSQIIEENDRREKENQRRLGTDQPQLPYVDPKEPEMDRRLAEGLLGHNFNLIRQDRTEDDARMALKQLRPKFSAKTARERRVTEGRRFRGWQ